jgi:hypothetical protein
MISKLLSKYPDDKEFVLVSFFITNPKEVEKIHKQWASRDKEQKRYLDNENNKIQIENTNPDNFGGMIALIDPKNLKEGFLAKIPLNICAGICFNNHLFVGSSGEIKINN